MPYNYSHAIMAQSALKNCEKPTRERLLAHEDAFLLGTMGADPYYGDAFLPPVGNRARTELADLLHAADGQRLFSVMLEKCEGDDALVCYTAGFLCHFLLDNHAHPYISTRFPGDLHTPAEIAIDALMIPKSGEARYLVPPRAFYQTDAVPAIDALHARVCWKLFALRTEGIYGRALKKWLRVGNLQFDPRGRKRAALRPFPGITSYLITPGAPEENDLLNLTHALWGAELSGTGARTESLPALTDAATGEATALLDRIAGSHEPGDTTRALHALEGRTADASELLCR